MEYDLLDGAAARPLAGDLRDLYAEVYAEPPYNEGSELVERFAQHLADEVDRPGFALARAAEDSRLVGVAYGWTMPAGRWWSSADTPAPPELANVPKFAIIEWMVRRGYRHSRGRPAAAGSGPVWPGRTVGGPV